MEGKSKNIKNRPVATNLQNSSRIREKEKARTSGLESRITKPLRIILFCILPYIIINGAILMLIISSPDIKQIDSSTNDYKTNNVNFRVDCLLPITELNVTMDDVDIPYTKNGKTYTAQASGNGSLKIYAKSFNGMSKTLIISVSIIDDSVPEVVKDSISINNNVLSFKVNDNHTGVNFETIYALDEKNNQIKPKSTNKDTGEVTFEFTGEILTVYIYDMAGNQAQVSFDAKETQ